MIGVFFVLRRLGGGSPSPGSTTIIAQRPYYVEGVVLRMCSFTFPDPGWVFSLLGLKKNK